MNKDFKGFISIFLLLFLFISVALAYSFYLMGKNKQKQKFVDSCNQIAVDSIEARAVRDTILYYDSVLNESTRKIKHKDSVITNQIQSIQSLRKDKDSIWQKYTFYKQRYSDLKNSQVVSQ
jgi:lipase chaperone LimK